MNRKILAGVAIAVVGVVGVSAWLWSGNSSQKNDITLLGNVDIRQVSLAFQDSERIVEMRVEEGAKVTAGQVLAVLDTRTLELQAAQTEAQIEVNKKALLRLRNGSRPEEIGQAQARVDAATTDAKLAELDFQRMQSIAEETHGRGVSRQELDRAAATLKAARAKVEDQSMALRLAKLGPRSHSRAMTIEVRNPPTRVMMRTISPGTRYQVLELAELNQRRSTSSTPGAALTLPALSARRLFHPSMAADT